MSVTDRTLFRARSLLSVDMQSIKVIKNASFVRIRKSSLRFVGGIERWVPS